jgi:cytochrome c5
MRFMREHPRSMVLAAASALAAVTACSSGASQNAGGGGQDAGAIPGRACPPESSLTYESFGEPFFASWCTGCHSSQLSGDARRNAPPSVDYDTLDGIRKWLPNIYARAADGHTTMPPAGGPSTSDRQALGDWLACGAPGKDNGFQLPPSGDAAPPPPPTGTCAQSHPPLPTSVMPRCSAQTRQCMLSCTDMTTCPGNCLAADTTPSDPSTGLDCTSCYYDQALACADPSCHDTIAQYVCCVYSKCPSGDSSCVDAQCSAENDAFELCLYYVTPHCLESDNPLTSACFGGSMGRPADAGVGD